MADPFVAEIRIMTCNFAPKGWAHCNGQVLPISQNTALFSLLGTNFGGNGKSTFALPDLQARAPLHVGQGQGIGLSERTIGEAGGEASVTLTEAHLPVHTHTVNATSATATQTAPGPSAMLGATGTAIYANAGDLAPRAQLASRGAGVAHNNLQPYLALNFCIALQGVFPARG